MKSGQTLIILLVFMMVSIIVTTTAITLAISGVQASGRQVLSSQALDIAESGIENALIKLLRDPSYTGETLTVGDGIATIVVTGSGDNTITSIGRYGNFERTIRVTTTYSAGITSVTSWQEIFP
jgi:hypothetical protein